MVAKETSSLGFDVQNLKISAGFLLYTHGFSEGFAFVRIQGNFGFHFILFYFNCGYLYIIIKLKKIPVNVYCEKLNWNGYGSTTGNLSLSDLEPLSCDIQVYFVFYLL